jgi:predicted enzyme related to lactoylglutathione lyase
MPRLSHAIVAVSDMNRSVVFYRDLFGIQPVYTSDEWTEFSTGSTALALHSCGPGAAPPPGQHPAGTAWIAFSVEDIHAFHKEAIGKGVRCLQEPTDEGWGMNAVYADPDGCAISVSTMKAHG